jgi:hypothetical protein
VIHAPAPIKKSSISLFVSWLSGHCGFKI